ncbi:hypothetical protein ES702_05523 [subsurface metagenome]
MYGLMFCEFRSVRFEKFIGFEIRKFRGAGESGLLIRFLTDSTMFAAARLSEN